MDKSRSSKIPIAITRVRTSVRKRGAVGKLESTIKRNNKQLECKEPLKSCSARTIKKIPNFKKLHRQFEAHIARGKVKKKPATVFVEFPSKDNKQNVSLSQCRKSIKKMIKRDEMTVASIPSVAMAKKVNKAVQEHIDDDFMLRFKELCEQYETAYCRRPLLRVSKHNKSSQLHDDADIRSLVEKASYSQCRRCTMHSRSIASPGYTREMQEASDAMLRSVKRLYEPKHHYRRLDDVRTNLVNQLDCCSDKFADPQCRRNTMIL